MILHGLFGVGGHGRQVMPFFRDLETTTPNTRCVFIEDTPNEPVVNGTPVMSWNDFLKAADETSTVAISVGSGEARKSIEKRVVDEGLGLASAHHQSVVVMDSGYIDEGAVLSPFVCISSNVEIGRQFQANAYSYVSHECKIGDYVTFAPRATCCGHVVIEDSVSIGAGAVIRNGRPGKPIIIGSGATVGIGAVVTKSVPPGDTVFGNPAKSLKTRRFSST